MDFWILLCLEEWVRESEWKRKKFFGWQKFFIVQNRGGQVCRNVKMGNCMSNQRRIANFYTKTNTTSQNSSIVIQYVAWKRRINWTKELKMWARLIWRRVIADFMSFMVDILWLLVKNSKEKCFDQKLWVWRIFEIT